MGDSIRGGPPGFRSRGSPRCAPGADRSRTPRRAACRSRRAARFL